MCAHVLFLFSQRKVSAHRCATRELLWHRNGAMSAAVALVSEGRGDGWDRIHAFLRGRKLDKEKNTIQTSDATLKL